MALTRDEMQAAVDLLASHGTLRRAAKAGGMHLSTLRHRLRAAKREGLLPATAAEAPETVTVELGPETGSVATVSSRIRTAEEAFARTELSADEWQIVKVRAKSYEQASKHPTTGAVTITPMWAIHLDIARRRTRPFELAVREAREAMAAASPVWPARPPRQLTRAGEACMVEIALPDLHLGKLAWKPETGDDYDSKIAVEVFTLAVQHFLRRVEYLNVQQIVLPIGNDLLHVDSSAMTTTGGTPQDTDTRLMKMIRACRRMLTDAIEQASVIAPVVCPVVRGNHDREKSVMIGEILAAWFRNCPRVEIRDGLRGRCYHRFGATLIGWAHGDRLKESTRAGGPSDLKGLMIDEAGEDWIASRWREWHLGHYHARRETKYNAHDTHGGLTVRVLPSLSGTDAWHYEQGYVHAPKEAVALVYGAASGPMEQHTWRPPAEAYGGTS